MRIEIAHELGEAEAIGRVDGFLDDLVRSDFQGAVHVKNPTRAWTGNQLALSFTLAKGFFQARLSGTITVTGRLVTLEATVPGMVTAFVGEDRIRAGIERELVRVLAKN
jgi:Putative polyhydroxyalkanoic acid system protein (PHA_gran_rgn)